MSEKHEGSLIPSWAFPSFLRNFPLPFEDNDFFPSQALQNSGLSIYEDKNQVIVEAELPGLLPKDIDVTFEKGVLHIKGARKEEEKDKEKKYYRKSSSSFSYKVEVPGFIDEKSEPSATYKDGIMKIAFNKAASSKAKKIEVKG
jgi:HSP20 family protein